MIGPPPDPRWTPIPATLLDDPLGHAVCIALGAALCAAWFARRLPEGVRVPLLILGLTLVLTSPWAAHVDQHWLGAFPTIDKEGSLLFYLDGVHTRSLAHPIAALQDPAVQLIGVHTGHLWLIALADILLSPMGAFGLWTLLTPALGWWAMTTLLRRLGHTAPIALAMGFPFGMGLHVFRDLNWYTIEKAQVFWLPVFALAWVLALGDGPSKWRLAVPGLLWTVITWNNLYFGILIALGAVGWTILQAVASPRSPAVRRAVLAGLGCMVLGLPLVLWQHLLLSEAPPLATPEAFLWQRAALDSLSIVPLAWNRLELWRALSPVAVAFAAVGMWHQRHSTRARQLGVLGLGLTAVALGPALITGEPGAPARVANPVYMALHAVIPGFWRVAKPEVFFQLPWLLILVAAAAGARQTLRTDRQRWMLLGAVIALWLVSVRTHPAFPGMSTPVQSTLAPDWQRRTFRP